MKHLSYCILESYCNEICRLVESRGIAVHAWRKEIGDISKSIKSRIALSSADKKIKFNAPLELCDAVSFLKGLRLEIISEQIDSENDSKSGSGWTNGDVLYDPNTSVLLNAVVHIDCYHFRDSGVKEKTLLGPLYHEMNHLAELWADMVQRKNANRFIKSVEKADKDPSFSAVINKIIYRLFSETEFNALVASVYGELKGMRSDRRNFSKDFARTAAASVYSEISSNYEDAVDSLSDKDAKRLKEMCILRDIRISARNDGVAAFKAAFKHKTALKLKELMKKCGKTASLRYDDREAEPQYEAWISTKYVETDA